MMYKQMLRMAFRTDSQLSMTLKATPKSNATCRLIVFSTPRKRVNTMPKDISSTRHPQRQVRMHVAVFPFEVHYKGFLASSHFVLQLPPETGEVADMQDRAGRRSSDTRMVRGHDNGDTPNRFSRRSLPESIASSTISRSFRSKASLQPNVVKTGSRLEGIVGIPEGIPVAAQPVIADRFQSPDELPPDQQPCPADKSRLACCSKVSVGLRYSTASPLRIKKPATFERAVFQRQRLDGFAIYTIAHRTPKINRKGGKTQNYPARTTRRPRQAQLDSFPIVSPRICRCLCVSGRGKMTTAAGEIRRVRQLVTLRFQTLRFGSRKGVSQERGQSSEISALMRILKSED